MKQTVIVLLIILLFTFALNKYTHTMPTVNSNTPPKPNPSEEDLKNAFAYWYRRLPVEYVKKVEQLFRLETAHFKSGQFLASLSPGMLVFKPSFPYGWTSLKEFAEANGVKPSVFSTSRTFMTNKGAKQYVVFPNFETALSYVLWFLRMKRGGNVKAWNSSNLPEQEAYGKKLAEIRPRFYEAIANTL